jgi:CheY-like chemotaxis protein
MPEFMTVEIIRAAPAALWVVLALFVYLTLRTVITAQFTRLRSLNGPGFTMDFAAPLLEAQQTQDIGTMQGPNDSPPPSASERRGTVSRLEHAAEYLHDRRILWVDDHPELNTSLVTLFRKVGMTVDTVRSTQEAIEVLRRQPFDLIISDMRRDTEEPAATAGYTLVETLADKGIRVPVILFTGHLDTRQGLPPGLFAHTSGGDNLVQYVIDVMERIQFGIGMRVPVRRR